MQTSIKAILLFALAAFLGAVGQYLFKLSAQNGQQGFVQLALNPRIWAAVVLYFAVMALFIMAFKLGGELSVLYPVYATTFIWAALIGRYALHEAISPARILGMCLIALGVFCIAK